MSLEDLLFNLQLELEDCSLERVRTLGQRLRPYVTVSETTRRSVVFPVLAALAQSPVLNDADRTDRFVAFTAALGMEPSDVAAVLKEWEAAGSTRKD